MKTYRINATGLNEIAQWLGEHDRRAVESGEGAAWFDESMLRAWAADAEFQISEGNPPSIELRAYQSINGRTEEFTVSNAGLDASECEVDE